MAYLFDAATLAEVLRSVPSRTLVRRLTNVPTRDRWTSVISVSQLLVAARKHNKQKLMQDVIRLVAAVRVAPFDLTSAQQFAKYLALLRRRDGRSAAIFGRHSAIERCQSGVAADHDFAAGSRIRAAEAWACCARLRR